MSEQTEVDESLVEKGAGAIHDDGLWDLHEWARKRIAHAVLAAVLPDVRRAVAEEIYMAGEGHYGSPVVAAYEAARRIAREATR